MLKTISGYLLLWWNPFKVQEKNMKKYEEVMVTTMTAKLLQPVAQISLSNFTEWIQEKHLKSHKMEAVLLSE